MVFEKSPGRGGTFGVLGGFVGGTLDTAGVFGNFRRVVLDFGGSGSEFLQKREWPW